MNEGDLVGMLRRAIEQADPTWVNQPSHLRRRLEDELGPESRARRAEVHLLVVGAEERLPARLRRGVWSTTERDRLVDLLVSTRGWTPVASHWVVATWAAALGLTDEVPPPLSGSPSSGTGGSTPDTSSSTPAASAQVQGPHREPPTVEPTVLPEEPPPASEPEATPSRTASAPPGGEHAAHRLPADGSPGTPPTPGRTIGGADGSAPPTIMTEPEPRSVNEEPPSGRRRMAVVTTVLTLGLVTMFVAWLTLLGGGDESWDGPEAEADDPVVRAVTIDMASDEGDFILGDQVAAECMSRRVVGALGQERLEQLGVTASNGFSLGEIEDLDFTAAEVITLYEALASCVDMEANFAAALTANGTVTQEQATCISRTIGEEDFVRLLPGDTMGDEAARAGLEQEYENALERCVGSDG